MSGIATGFKKGHIVQKRELPTRISRRKGILGKRTKFIRELIFEVTGLTPYERRIREVLTGGGNNPTKRATKFAKKRLGTMARAKRKVNEIQNFIERGRK